MTVFGVHTGPSKTDATELLGLWRRIEELPFDWISIWDHFYAADGDSTNCLEGVASHTALAMSTDRVRCGSLVYCAGYRHPAVLANAMAAIDQFSGGRCEVGLGAGWLEQEFAAHGIALPARAPPPRHAGRVRAGGEGAALGGAVQLRRRALHASTTPSATPTGPPAHAHLDRRRRREAHPAHRRRARGRLERAVHLPRAVRPQVRGARRALRSGRP